VETNLHLLKANETSMLFGFFVSVESLKTFHHESSYGLNLLLIEDFKKIWFQRDLLLIFFFGGNLVTL